MGNGDGGTSHYWFKGNGDSRGISSSGELQPAAASCRAADVADATSFRRLALCCTAKVLLMPAGIMYPGPVRGG